MRGGRAHLVDTLVDTTRDTTEVQFQMVSLSHFFPLNSHRRTAPPLFRDINNGRSLPLCISFSVTRKPIYSTVPAHAHLLNT